MTCKNNDIPNFVVQFMNSFKIISLTHKRAPLQLVGKLHLDESHQKAVLGTIKSIFGLEEFLFLSTCNRVEFILKADINISPSFLGKLFCTVNPLLTEQELVELSSRVSIYEGEAAFVHLCEVASSLDSLVVGEREIITQVRKAYEFCNTLGITGDTIRLAMKQVIETAKKVYTDTAIAKNPVSIVSLAYRQLRSLGIKNDARIVFIGAGETNTTMAKYLKKHEYANFTVFNRSLANAQKLATELNGQAIEWSSITSFKEGFDVLITCTASQQPLITDEIYTSLLNHEVTKKVVIDMAIPADLDPYVIKNNSLFYINIDSLKQQADENLLKRESEIAACRNIIAEKLEEFKLLFQERKIEVAFSEIPKQIKTIKETAVNDVFAKEMNALDVQSKAVLEKVLNYMEKKYNALAIKTAKKALLEEQL